MGKGKVHDRAKKLQDETLEKEAEILGIARSLAGSNTKLAAALGIRRASVNDWVGRRRRPSEASLSLLKAWIEVMGNPELMLVLRPTADDSGDE